jgi:hypothetical protein
MGIFLRSKHFFSVLSVYALMVFKVFQKLFTTLLAAGKMRTNCLFTGCFTEPQVASCNHFLCQNRRYRVFEAGYWMDFQNY